MKVESAALEKIVKDNGFKWGDYGDFADLLEKGIDTSEPGGIYICTSVSKIIVELMENALHKVEKDDGRREKVIKCKEEIEKNSQKIDADYLGRRIYENDQCIKGDFYV